MGKSVPSIATLHKYARFMSSLETITATTPKPTPNHEPSPSNSQPSTARVDPVTRLGLRFDKSTGRIRVPLSRVVSDCVRRWFFDTLEEAKAGDRGMQLLVGQMYNSGYGVRKDTELGRAWIARASKGRSSALDLSYKRRGLRGYVASDLESEDFKDFSS